MAQPDHDWDNLLAMVLGSPPPRHGRSCARSRSPVALRCRHRMDYRGRCPCIEALPPFSSGRAGDVLEHIIGWVQRLRHTGEARTFKIGVTTAPAARFHDPDFGYQRLGYSRFLILYDAPPGQPMAAAFLEAALIKHFRPTEGCRNVAPGGEGIDARGQAVYVVYVALTGEDLHPED